MWLDELVLPRIPLNRTSPSDKVDSDFLRPHHKRISLGTSFFGRELRVGWELAMNRSWLSEFDLNAKGYDAILVSKSLSKLYKRPASEPIILSFISERSSPEWTMDSAVQLACLLRGAPTKVRTDRIKSLGGDGIPSVGFEKNGSEKWLDSMNAVRESFPNFIERAIASYAVTTILHPLADGNGRLARAIINIELASLSENKCPFLPMSPVFYRTAYHNVSLIHEFCNSGDWDGYIHSMTPLLRSALHLTLDDIDKAGDRSGLSKS